MAGITHLWRMSWVLDCPRVCDRIPFWFLAEGGVILAQCPCAILSCPAAFQMTHTGEQQRALGFKNRLLQIDFSKYTRGRVLSLKWLLNTHLALTMLKSGSADLRRRFAWALWSFIQEMAPSNQGFVVLGGKSPPMMMLAKSTVRVSLLGLTHNNYCRFLLELITDLLS